MTSSLPPLRVRLRRLGFHGLVCLVYQALFGCRKQWHHSTAFIHYIYTGCLDCAAHWGIKKK